MTEPLESPNPVKRVEPDARQRFAEAVDLATQDEATTVRVRCELRLYDRGAQKYLNWNDATWTVDVQANVEHGMALKGAFDAFFDQLIAKGPAGVVARLQGE